MLVGKVITNRRSVAHTHKNMLSIDLLLKMGAKTMSPEEIATLKKQKQALQSDMKGIDEDVKNDVEMMARRKRFQNDEKVSLPCRM